MRLAALPLAVVALLSWGVALADEPSELPARRYLYCANVAQFYYQYFLRHDPASEKVALFRATRDNFRLAAAATKAFPDNATFVAENDAALKRVVAVLEREKAEKSELMSGESKSCAATMDAEVVPLLQPKPSAPAE